MGRVCKDGVGQDGKGWGGTGWVRGRDGVDGIGWDAIEWDSAGRSGTQGVVGGGSGLP